MDKGWKDIQAQINKKEEPLSDTAWSNLEQKLNRENRGKALWLLLLLFLVPLFFIEFDGEQNKQRPLNITQQSETSLGETKADEKLQQNAPNQKTSEMQTKTEEVDANKSDLLKRVAIQSPPTQNNAAIHTKNIKTNTQEADLAIDNQTKSSAQDVLEAATNLADNTVKQELQDAEVGEHREYLETESEGSSDDNQPSKTRSEKLVRNEYNWEIKVFGALTVNSANMSYQSEPGFTHKELAVVSENSAEPGLGFDAGVEVSYFVTPHFKVSSGIGIRRFTTQNTFNYEVSEIPVMDSATGQILGYLPAGQPATYQDKSVNSYTYFSIPVSLFYEQQLTSRWSVTGEFVNTAQLFIQQNSTSINPQSLEVRTTQDNTFNKAVFSYQLKVGLRYYFNDKTAVSLEPAYRGHYSNIYNSTILQWRPTDWSVNLAIIYRLGRIQTKNK